MRESTRPDVAVLDSRKKTSRRVALPPSEEVREQNTHTQPQNTRTNKGRTSA